MTSEPDSTPRRRPPTIDLTATEIETQKQAATPGGTPPDAGHAGEPDSSEKRGGGRRAGLWPLAAAAAGAAAGVAVTAALAFGLWLAGVLPSRNATPPAANNATGAVSAQLDKIEAELQSRPADSALATRLATLEAQTTRLATLEAQTKTVGYSLAAINRRLDDIAVAAKSAGERADAAAAAAKAAAQNSVKQSELDALSSRIGALQTSIAALAATTAQRTGSTDDRAARAAIAAEALRAAVARGAPFAAELAAVKSFRPDQNAVAALAPFAAGGVPSAEALGRELAQIVASLRQAAGAPPGDVSFLGRLEDGAKHLVRITPINAPAGNRPSAIVARLDADAAHADIAAALADIDRLPQSAKTLAAPWVAKAKARNAALAASGRIVADALTALGNAATSTSRNTQ